MSVLEVEFAVLIVVLVAGIVAHVMTYRGIVRLVGRREKAMDVHAKAVTRGALNVTNEAKQALADAQNVREDTRLMQQRVEQHLSEFKRPSDG